jgi:hypothetical protein
MKKKQDNSEDKQALWHLVGGKLRARLRAGSPACPDPATLAAYFDLTLTPSERARVEVHLTGCGDCQEHLAEVARLTEGQEQPVVLIEEETVSAPARSGWGMQLAWAVPLIATVLVIGLWYPNELRRFLRLSPAPIAVGENAPAEPAEVAEARPPAQPQSPPAPAAAKNEADAALIRRRELADEKMKSEDLAARSSEEEFAEKRDQAEAPAMTVLGARRAAEQAGEGAGAESHSIAALKKPEGPALTVMEGPSRADRAEPGDWRVGRLGLIQKVSPAGEWVTVPSGVRADLFDVTFPTPLVGWAVGAGGTVLRSTDGGKTWRRVKGPIEEDLVRVSASDANSARVVTRSGRGFATSDAGASWSEFDLR